MTDSGNQKLANCFTFPTSALQIKVMAVGPAPRPGPAPEPNAALRVGMMGEAGDFKCLTFVKLKPRPVRKPGLFFKREPRCSASWARCDRSPLLALAGFPRGTTTRDSGLLVLHYLDVVPLAGSSQVTQSECLLSQLRNLARVESCSSTVRPTRCVHLQIVEADGQLSRRYVACHTARQCGSG